MATTASAISWSPCLSSGGKQQQASSTKCVSLTFLTTRNTSVSVNSAAAPSSLLHCSFIPSSSSSSARSLSLPSSFSGLSLGLDLSTNVGVGRRNGSGVVVRAERSAPPRPEKKRSRSPNQTTEVAAYAKFVRISAHKARRVVDQIRGRSYEESLMILELMPYRACDAVLKLVYSAAANASHNKGLNKASLIVSKAEVSEGKTVKKLRCRARGRGVPVRRSNCHITIFLKDISVDEQL